MVKKFKEFSLNESSKPKYTLDNWNTINGIEINEDIFDEEAFDYKIEYREDLIENITQWAQEAKRETDRLLMLGDIEELSEVEDEYIFSAVGTNYYLYQESGDEFNQACEDLLELSGNWIKDKATKKFKI